ncbi:ribonuclease H family protein [Roseimaritima ulvae]|uniref:Ribonuclease HIII n=1 Tax=Roseimaritima ulvae TaxID=980254 RepID=A0A5B9QKN5_9BACT|nr:hypothetical protein [Roseimaritima ulvae]QEG39454.1 Hypothetical protein UC8_14490 [Roseimaritima ulvae]
MLLIATDEAGYGPKLGPLVVTATIWRLPEIDATQAFESFDPLPAFAALSTPVQAAELPRLKLSVADSKRVFKPRQASGLLALEAIVLAATRWAWPHWQGSELQAWLEQLNPADVPSLQRQPWFSPSALQQPFPQSDRLAEAPSSTRPPETETICDALLKVWTGGESQLIGVRQRVVDAQRFNQRCGQGVNKAQLLSETTAGLVVEILNEHDDSAVTIYSDRHGGRAYYGGLLQHFLPAASLTVVSETARESHYVMRQQDRQLQWRFTVKGDSFTPVSLASMFAKYTRERLMDCFNRYWRDQHSGQLSPTAGYPSDANRFLRDIQPTIERLKIQSNDLIRQR